MAKVWKTNEIKKYFVQGIAFVHEFMNNAWIMNNIGSSNLLYIVDVSQKLCGQVIIKLSRFYSRGMECLPVKYVYKPWAYKM